MTYPRIQILNPNNKLVTEQGYPSGQFCLAHDNEVCAVLGTSFVGVPLDVRAQAMRIRPDGTIHYWHDRKSPEYERCIQGGYNAKGDSYYHGPQFLIDMPDLGQLATLHFCTQRLRDVAIQMRQSMSAPLRVTLKRESGYRFHYYIPEFEILDTGYALTEAKVQAVTTWRQK